jgi:hypothetical protein
MECQSCRRNVPTKYVEYQQNIGMLVLRTRRSVRANLCKRCSSRYFWELTGLTLVTGWWGVISFVLNWVFIIQNIVAFCSTRSLADVPEGGFPVSPQQAGVRTPPVQQAAANAGGAAEPPNPYRQQ